MRVVHQVAQSLSDGQTVTVFPEGTTTDGQGLLPFHANLLQAAISTGAPIQAVALRFSDQQEPVSAAAAYVGDTNLLESVWAVVSAQRMVARVQWLDALDSRHGDRRALARTLRQRILDELNVTEWRDRA